MGKMSDIADRLEAKNVSIGSWTATHGTDGGLLLVPNLIFVGFNRTLMVVYYEPDAKEAIIRAMFFWKEVGRGCIERRISRRLILVMLPELKRLNRN